jgi:hypothetical protein
VTKPTRWQQYIERSIAKSPFGLLSKENIVIDELQKKRYDICIECPELINATKQCRKCGCFMQMKTKLIDASCPIGKW